MHRIAFALVLISPLTFLRADAPSPAKVADLLKQLEANSEVQRLDASVALLRLGPDVLPLLPKEKPSRELQSVIDRLTEVKGKTVTIAQGTSLADALKAITTQTGQTLRDARGDKKATKTSVALTNASFWQAADLLAADAGAALNVYGVDGAITLVDRVHNKPLPVSHHHAFRTIVNKIVLVQDLGGGEPHCRIDLETSWEPRLLPLLTEMRPVKVVFAPDADGKRRTETHDGRERSEARNRHSVEFSVRVPAPKRTSPAIETLEGTIVLVMAPKFLKFNFDKLSAAKPPVQEQDSVKVMVKTVVEPDRWEIDVAIDHPLGSPTFQSHQSWWQYNRIELTKGKQHWEVSPFEKEGVRSSLHWSAKYDFLAKANKAFKGSVPGDWTLTYQTPGRMIELEVPFRFEKLPLP